MLAKIYDPFRLEDEVDGLAAAAEEDRVRKKASVWDGFRNKEIRIAFLVGGGLQVRLCMLKLVVCRLHE